MHLGLYVIPFAQILSSLHYFIIYGIWGFVILLVEVKVLDSEVLCIGS